MKLEAIIGQFLNSADQTSHQFLRLWNTAVFGIKTEFNLDITGVYKTKVLDVNANKTVDFPCDYIQYRKIGLINAYGEVVTFKRNDQLSNLNSGNSLNRLSGSPKTGNSIIGTSYPYNNLYCNFYQNGYMYNLFGADSGTANIGEYKIDQESKQILLSPTSTHSQIVMEYLCDGCDSELGIIDIDVRAAACMLAYIRWQDSVDKPKKFNQSQINGFMKEFYRTKRISKMRMNPFILNEMRDAEHSSRKLVAKS